MEKIESRFFDTLAVHGIPVEVFLSHTEDFTLISIPRLSWCFLWEIARNEEETKLMIQGSLISNTHSVNGDTAEQFVEELHQYLLGKGK